MMKMWTSVSNTAEYGGLSQRDKLITEDTKKAMEQMLKNIQTGKFAKEWLTDAIGGMKKLQSMEEEEATIEDRGRRQGHPRPVRDEEVESNQTKPLPFST